MNIALWIVQILLALVFLGAGVIKATQPLPSLREKVGDWVDDVPLPLIRFVGVAEIAGAIGLVLPPAVDVLPDLAIAAAIGLAITMVGAVVIHARRREWPNAVVNLALLAAAAFVAWGRLDHTPF